MINKVVASTAEAVADIESGAMIAIGGFNGVPGIPSSLIKAVADRSLSDLTIISCEAGRGKAAFQPYRRNAQGQKVVGVPELEELYPAAYLVECDQVKKAITTFSALNHPDYEGPLEARARKGEVEIELIGQGSLCERLRAGRVGLGGVYTPVGAGTLIGKGKDVRYFDGVPHILETALKPDYAIIAAYQADRFGNLTYRNGARTLNPVMAGSARVTIVEVEEIVPLGHLDPNHIVTPGPYVDRVVLSPGGRVVE
ncbi:CoA transferase subunit A [Phytoactinopolyspora limicola]|uniref:CoA transferase subunit A n=1 Tax=Phytoactinopolyspora limicola TaxID=2715536 RepID=UPI00140C51E2|nr:3-oxoacid CoA-transferase subunit A [Phytoactinopolyspora limicola]